MSSAPQPKPSVRAAVLGHPIGHSQSPSLHAAAYAFLGLDIAYSRYDVPEEELLAFLSSEGAGSGWVGWSVTMPLKGAMVEAMDEVSARVQTLGVLNTVVHRQGSGGISRYGENTDVDGIVEALLEAGLDWPGTRPGTGSLEAGSGSLAIIGAGATASACLAAAAELGFSDVRAYARSPERAASLEPVAQALELELSVEPLETLFGHLESAAETPSAVVSTLPPRAADPIAERLPARLSTASRVPLLDVAYDPWPSKLAKAWESAGGTVVSGLVMLLHQAVKQVELFTAGTAAPAAELEPEEHAQMVAAMRQSLPAGADVQNLS